MTVGAFFLLRLKDAVDSHHMNDLLKLMNSLRLLPTKERKKFRSLYYIFNAVDRQTERFKKTTGLRCIRDCGHCCEVSKVEVTVLEMLPFAVYACDTGEADYWLGELQKHKGMIRCVFYKKENACKQGHCRIYPLRPLLCRLFGFSVSTDKYHERRLVCCELINQSLSPKVKKAQEFIMRNQALITMQDFAMRVWNVDPLLSQELFVLNDAAQQALEIVGLKLGYIKKAHQGNVLPAGLFAARKLGFR